MAIKYDTYEKPHPDGQNNEEKGYYARIIYRDTVTTAEIASDLEYGTTMTQSDVVGAVSSLGHAIEKYLSEGSRVHIEGLGYFQLAITGPVVSDPKKMRADQLHVKTIKFFPEKKMLERLASVKFERTSGRVHSESRTEEEIIELLAAYFTEKSYITRAEFQTICGFTKSMALKRLNALLDKKVLCRGGGRHAAVYEKGVNWGK